MNETTKQELQRSVSVLEDALSAYKSALEAFFAAREHDECYPKKRDAITQMYSITDAEIINTLRMVEIQPCSVLGYYVGGVEHALKNVQHIHKILEILKVMPDGADTGEAILNIDVDVDVEKEGQA